MISFGFLANRKELVNVPLVTPRESMAVGAAGVAPVQDPMVGTGRPPAKEEVTAMRRVLAPIWALVRENEMLMVPTLLKILFFK